MKYNKDPKFIGKMFDEISPTYIRLNHIFSGAMDIKWRREAVRFLKSTNSKFDYVLDLASGTGDLAKEFLKLNPEEVYSVDLSEEMLKINKRKVNSAKNIIIQGDAEHLPFKDSTFDLVGIAFGVRNFQHLEKCITEINRVLKPGGRFLTIEMFKNSKNSLSQKTFKLYFSKIMPKIGNMLSGSKYAYDYLFESVDSFLSVKSYSDLLISNGFEKEHIKNNFLSIVHTIIFVKN